MDQFWAKNKKRYIKEFSRKKFLHTNNKDTYGLILGKKRYIKEFSPQKIFHNYNKWLHVRFAGGGGAVCGS